MDDTVWVESAAKRSDEVRSSELTRAALARPHAPFREPPPRLLLVDIERQRLFLVVRDRVERVYPISTAAAGVGGTEGSLRTPPGWHRIHARIGAGAPAGAVFESRVPTGAVWLGESRAEDLILARVLTLAGLEPGVNQGPGVDSLERYIYFHGTNHVAELGRPVSHGCIRLANDDVIDLFERVEAGDPVAIVGGERAEPVEVSVPAMPDPLGPGRFHYAGLGGSGMSALAQFQAMRGGRASGSDRAFDRGERAEARAQLERLGIEVRPQDGSGITDDCAALVVSTAVEAEVPDVAAARARGVPIVHRSDLLAHFVGEMNTIAIAGTSGKSTAVAMTFEILRGVGLSPSVITGGDLVMLQNEGLLGNAWAGESSFLVIEADESDGSLVRYQPTIGVVMNLQRDHREMSEVAKMFTTFRSRTRERFVVGEADNLADLADSALVFGFGPRAAVRGTDLEVGPDGCCSFAVDGVRFRLPVPGVHNVENALAAIAAVTVCNRPRVPLAEMVAPLAKFHGVGRRFQVLGRPRGVEVVDDFAHNPAKLAAAIATARGRARRVFAIYQPHGFGPTRFLRPDLVETFSTALGPDDRLWLLEVFYAGGTAQRDFSAADIAGEIAARGTNAEFAPSRPWLIERIGGLAQAGDLVLIMGARDPSLTGFGRELVAALEG